MIARYWDSDPADSAGDVNVNGGGGVNIESPVATQFYIQRTGQNTYQVRLLDEQPAVARTVRCAGYCTVKLAPTW